MPYRADIVDELNLLVKFDRHSSIQTGIKVHHDAAPEMVAAAKRLFDKGLTSQTDGGYLTDRGLELAERAHELVSALDINPT
ncbi:MAG: TIGR02647 family protein [Saccharospirillaceae bacterium]|nr:DNA-binding protein [Thalassolituus sp. HI0120]MCH2041299.1 TIGR02647 family protein [Saccharospirillaceae bacterium]